jgi:heme-degrading monooxygenase HmoA
MYGTVARMRLKPGMEERMQRMSEEQAGQISGIVGEYVYRMDSDPNEYYLVVIFESKEAYVANANSPEQHARYQDLVAMMEAEPEWHDGEIVHQWSPS